MADVLERLKAALSDRYTIERELGSGGMATVYLAQDLKHERQVAVKVLRPELAAVLGHERFVQEIKTTANLQHPHILPLFDSGEADGFLYYVMPYIEGETLRGKLNRETQFGIEEAVGITTEVADALDYAHRHKVVHRDIKPENILLQDGRPMVADFGIALAVSAAAGGRLTETGLSLGTPHYMSPEQATAEKELTNRSDIYSLGCVMYEMLTGEPPHTGSSAQQIIMKIVTDEARPVRELRKSVPQHIAAATAMALERLPADRFESASKFAEALANPAFTTRVAAGASAATRGEGWWGRLTVGLAALSTLLIVVTVLALLRTAPEARRPVIRYTLMMEEGQEAIWTVFGPNMTLSPDGSRLVYVGANEIGRQLWLRDRDQLLARPLPGTDGAYQTFFSPDGQRVGFITADRGLKLISLGGEPPVTLATGIGRGGGSWGSDGYVYYLTESGGGLSRVSVTGGDPEIVSVVDTTRAEASHRFPDVLPNGRGVLFTISRPAIDEQDVAVLDLSTGEHRVLYRGVLARYAPTGHVVIVRADGALLAAPFDQDRLEPTGPATPLLEGVAVLALGSVDLTLSDAGTLLYGRAGGVADPDEMVWVARDGTIQQIDPDWTADFSTLALSPDGAQLAVSIREAGEAQVWIKQLDRGPLSRLTFEGTGNYYPAWTTDGLSVTFASNRGVDSDIYVKRADGSTDAEVFLDLDYPITRPRWSSDGEWLVFTALEPGDNDIYAIRPRTDGEPVALVAEEGIYEYAATLSPDGRWIAYVSNETGRYEVYVRPFPNADAKWLISVDGGTEPRWAHSGRELFYRSSVPEMVVAEIQSDPTFAVGERRVLFSWGDLDNDRFDVAPDDQRFLFVRSRAELSERFELVVVENFFEELKAKVGENE
jgi:serine/threonine-protein kinase